MLGWCSINLDNEGSCSLFLCDVELPLSLQISPFFFFWNIYLIVIWSHLCMLLFKVDVTVLELRVLEADVWLCSNSMPSSPTGDICRIVSASISATHWSHVHNAADWTVQTSAWFFTTSRILSLLLESVFKMESLCYLFRWCRDSNKYCQ